MPPDFSADIPSKALPSCFPFTALVGQEEMKLALILNAVSPKVGGVLLRGQKGTAKSTAVRALAQLLPEIQVVQGCRFSCDPAAPAAYCRECSEKWSGNGGLPAGKRRVRVVDLPLNATEEMVIGGLDFGRTLKSGQRHLMQGLLARAHRGVLYIDEVNLLDDHLVDIILDAASSGVNQLEREGVSHWHASEFVLVGSMNPEEGELRPQLLDRFGLCVEVSGEPEPEQRLALLELREAFDLDPRKFQLRFQNQQASTAQDILKAREMLPKVRIPARVHSFITALSRENNVAGHRADLVMERAALALAAHEGRQEVGQEDVVRVAPMALRHRRRDPLPPPPPEPPPPREPEEEPPQEDPPQDNAENQENQPEESPEDDTSSDLDQGFELPLPEPPNPEQDGDAAQDSAEQIFEIGQTFKVRPIIQPKDRKLRRGSGRRSSTRTAQKQGRYVKSSVSGLENDLALDATLRAAAPYQKKRQRQGVLKVNIKQNDMRLKVREKRVGTFLLFLVDASGSMGVKARMAATKGAILSLLLDAYQKRDKVCLIAFRGQEAELVLPPTSSVEAAARLLKELPVGGRTPLSAGLSQAHHQLTLQLRKDPLSQPMVIVLTDGKGNVSLGAKHKPHEEALVLADRMAEDERVKFVVVDTEPQGVVRLGLAGRLAAAMNAEIFRIEDLKAQDLVDIARRSQP